MTWRVAKTLLTLREEINSHFPFRGKASDGTIGDPAHASRKSDHNPWVRDGHTGVVTAMDITNDPLNGVNCAKISEAIRVTKNPRVKYVIFNRRIFWGEGYPRYSPWIWRAYHRPNAHDKHMHVSVKPQKTLYDSTVAWFSPVMWKTLEKTDALTS